MTYEKIFTDVRKALIKADVEKLDREFAFQFNIIGSGEGTFYAAYKNCELDVSPYDYKDNDAVLYASGDVFIKIANGVLSLEKAVKDGFLRINGNTALVSEIDKLVLKKTAAGKTINKNETAKALSRKSTLKNEHEKSVKPKRKTTARKKSPEMELSSEDEYDITEAMNLAGGFLGETDFFV